MGMVAHYIHLNPVRAGILPVERSPNSAARIQDSDGKMDNLTLCLIARLCPASPMNPNQGHHSRNSGTGEIRNKRLRQIACATGSAHSPSS
jgi:hypothetical protein